MRLIDADNVELNMRKAYIKFDTHKDFNVAMGVIDNTSTVITNSVYEAYCALSDEEFEHSDSFWITTPKGKKINFVKERPRGEWISVSKNMPNESGRYLITQGNSRFKTILIKYYDLGKKEFGTWHELPFDDDEEVWIPISDVIAWMPLPEAYKEAENDKDSN